MGYINCISHITISTNWIIAHFCLLTGQDASNRLSGTGSQLCLITNYITNLMNFTNLVKSCCKCDNNITTRRKTDKFKIKQRYLW